MIGGDFSAHSTEWGCPADKVRGVRLSNFAEFLGLQVCNVGTSPTYTRYNAASVMDVTFARLDPSAQVADWKVLADLGSESDHKYVFYTLLNRTKPRASPAVGL